MINIKEVSIDGKKHIEIDNRIYYRRENPIGVREKFWIIKERSPIFNEPMMSTNMLFKFNRNDVSCEDYGEVILSQVAMLTNMNCVEYYSAKFYKDGEEYKGVLCGSYKRTNEENEISGYALQNILTSLEYDEKTGKANKSINTVYGFLSDLDATIIVSPYRELYLETIKSGLLKQCVMDFDFAQTDRHWLNTTFLEFAKDNKYSIRKAGCYDNGCIAFLKRKKAALKTITSQIKGDYLNSPRMHELMHKYCPMFGVKTSTVCIDVDRANKTGYPEKLKLLPGEKSKEVFIDELTNQILHNGELAAFYIKLKDVLGYDRKTKNLDMSMVFECMELKNEDVDPVIKEMVTAVATYQINEIEEVLIKKIKNYKEKEEQEFGRY